MNEVRCGNTVDRVLLSSHSFRAGVVTHPGPFFWVTQEGNMSNSAAMHTVLRAKLGLEYPSVKFDHMEIAYLHRDDVMAVFVTKGDQSCVVYDRTEEFPSANLMASLVLLGSP